MKLFGIRIVTSALLIGGLVSIGSVSFGATILFQDTFDRPNSIKIDAVLTGITDNTGSSLPAGGVYSNGHIDPLYPGAGPNGTATDGGSADIASNQLQLAVGAGTSNAYVNHNFIDPSIINAGGFSVSVDVAGMSQSGPGQGGGFGIGMSQAEAASTGDAQNGDKAAGPGDFKMQDGLQDGSNQTSDIAVSDFWVVLRGDQFLQYGTRGASFPLPGAAYLGGSNVGAKTGTITANFQFPDFNNGTTVAYQLYYNGNFINSGTFLWTGTNENYIGLDARDSTFVNFDNFTISIPEPATVWLAMFGLALCGWRQRHHHGNREL
jgi:hypothetical protein